MNTKTTCAHAAGVTLLKRADADDPKKLAVARTHMIQRTRRPKIT